MRQRLVTVMNARSDEVDVFMTLPSREGEQFAAAGWYADLSAMPKNDGSKGLRSRRLEPGAAQGWHFQRQADQHADEHRRSRSSTTAPTFSRSAASRSRRRSRMSRRRQKRSRACDSTVTPFVCRGLKPAVAYTFSNMLHNIGGTYMANGKSDLCSPKGKKTLETYSRLLRDYGPPGVVNYSFHQISALYRSGRAAMAFESSNELRTVMEGGERLKDTGLMPFPAGDAGQVPTAIGWGMAVSAYSKQPDAAWYFVQWATSPEIQKKMALQGIAPPRPAVAKIRVPQWIDEQPVPQGMAGRARRACDQGFLGGRLSHRRQSRIARIHRAGGAGPYPEAEDRGSGLRGCRQGA